MNVSRTFKGQEVLKLFRARRRPNAQEQGATTRDEHGLSPSLKLQAEYPIILFRKNSGLLDAERCAVWTGQ